MKTVTKEYTIYEFKELSKDVQEKVLQEFRNNNDFPFLFDDIEEYLKTLLEENKIEIQNNLKVFGSLSYCQGDGCGFSGTFKYKGLTLISKQHGHYYHYNSYHLDYENYDDSELTEEQQKDIYEDFCVIFKKICKDLDKYGYDIIENENSDENIKEMIEANEYMFLSNGKIFNE